MSLSENMSEFDADALKKQLLTSKERLGEEFLQKLFQDIEKDTVDKSNSADLSQQQQLNYARQKLSDYSIFLAHKYEPILKEYITLREHQKLINQFSVIKAEQDHDFDLAKKYQMCFNAFLNATDDVSIRVCDKDLIKNVDVKDAFILSYFSFGTAKRQEADNLAQLAICGYTYVHFLAIFCFFYLKKTKY
jgi:hypothetical protein